MQSGNTETRLLDLASRRKKEIVKALVRVKADVNCTNQVSCIITIFLVLIEFFTVLKMNER